jgi:DNA recombination protein RmuC
MTTIILLAIVLLLLIVIIALQIKLSSPSGDPSIINNIEALSRQMSGLDTLLRDEFARNREEANRNAKEGREEMGSQIKNFSEVISKTIAESGNYQQERLETFANQLKSFQEQQGLSERASREEQTKALKSFEDAFSGKTNEMMEAQRLKLDVMMNQLDKIRETVEGRLKQLQEENVKKLDEMRATVDEKLHETLEKRLSESFKQVSERLEQVHKGLGEMQNLATGVGDLKKVLSNVKTRGTLGEIQLENILEQVLSPEQYEKNVNTRKEGREVVEFAIKLPGKDNSGQQVYLPIDSKFPIEDYHSLLDAYDTGDSESVASVAKSLENAIKKSAKDIHDKYIEPPYTTDFGIMFLPVEGLYAEIVRRTSLIETLQRDYKIVVTGPTTLAAILNSLQMGFRTLAIEKRSGEVWKILGAVKTEFTRFGDVLKKAQEKISKAGEDIDELVGTRTRKIQIKLKEVQELSITDTNLMLNNENLEDNIE